MNAPLRRGACPGLSAPMQTGDGLLVRLMPIDTISLEAFSRLCSAARANGNGIVEVTARGSIQVRGLTAESAPRFAAAVGKLSIAAEDGIPVHTDPLSGLDPDEIFDTRQLAADLRRALALDNLAARLSPKVSVTIAGGGAPGLDELAADVRFRAETINGDVALQVSVGGDRARARHVGFVAPSDAVEAAVRLVEVIAGRGRAVRARDILAGEGVAPFRQALLSCVKDVDGRNRSGRDGAGAVRMDIGMHGLLDGSVAYALGLAFGHAEASTLGCLVEAATAAGAAGMRTAPGRLLIVVGLASDALPVFAAAAGRLGFIARSDDPRRHVIACAGTPFCASGYIAARAIAPAIARAAAPSLGDSFSIHVSGCAKGCAHVGPAALTIVGTAEGCALIADGVAHDAPFAIVETHELNAAIAKYAGERAREARHV